MAQQSSSSGAVSPAEAEMYGLFAKWQALDQVTAQLFAIAMSSIIILVAAGHWIETLFNKYSNKHGNFRARCIAIVRPIKRLHGPKVIGHYAFFPGPLHLVFAYISINFIMLFMFNPQKAPMAAIMAKRFGWMAICNLCLTVFLALKNTPLSPLTGHSFESINILHRCCGYTTVLFVILHASTYTAALVKGNAVHLLKEPHQIAGEIAGACMLLIPVFAVVFVRSRHYELFYASHVTLITTILIAVGFHRPDISKKVAIITIVAGSMWFADRYIRMTRWISNFTHNYATITPLPDGATKVTLRRPVKARPGSFAFLWIPGIRLLQRHPFSIVHSRFGAEFVVRARGGFTRDLYNAACNEPGMRLRASIDGPYGHRPDANDFDKVLVIAGGSGATFAIPIVMEWAKRRKTTKDERTLDFIWTVRRRANLEWFKDEIAYLRSKRSINIRLYVTGTDQQNEVVDRVTREMIASSDLEKAKSKSSGKGVDQNVSPVSSRSASSDTSNGRPDVRGIIDQTVSSQVPTDRILVASCGPPSLQTTVNLAVTANLVKNAPSITMHLAEYNW